MVANGNLDSHTLFFVVWPYCLLSQMFLLSNIWSLDSILLIPLELPIFKIWFLIPNSHFLSFIIVWKNVLSYIIACFGNDLQRDWKLEPFRFCSNCYLLFATQIPTYRAAPCGVPSAEASACPGRWAWRWIVMCSMIF